MLDKPCGIAFNSDTVRLFIPSCHTMSSFIAAAVLLHTDIMFAYPAFLLASVIAFSRLYLYVHYPSDIIGGIALGTIIAHTSYAYYSTISNNFTPCGGTVEMIVLSFSSAFYFPILRLFYILVRHNTHERQIGFAVISSSPILN